LAARLDAYVYFNKWDAASNVSSLAISNMTNKIFLGQSRLYSVDDNFSTAPASDFNNDYPIYFLDVSRGITKVHQALGYMDVMICLMISPAQKRWRMHGDSDSRNDYDFRAVDGDGILYDLIDTNYKANYRNNSYDATVVQLTATNLSANSYSAYGGEYVVARFAVPRKTPSAYNLTLGKNIKLGVTSGSEGSETGQSYQVLLYTPKLTNSLIPVCEIQDIDGQWDSKYDRSARIKTVSSKTIKVPRDTSVTFNATNSYNTTDSPITNYQWTIGATVKNSTSPFFTTSFSTNGVYSLSLSVFTAAQMASTTGLTTETNGYNPFSVATLTPDLMPSALPFVFQVVDPPTNQTLYRPRPSPFIIGQNDQMFVDFEINKETLVNVSIVSMDGFLVKSLASGFYSPGFWTLAWNGKDQKQHTVGEGIYYAVLETQYGKDAKKILLVRLK
jgi:hypothetical protein